jgi:hypothetical protein
MYHKYPYIFIAHQIKNLNKEFYISISSLSDFEYISIVL